MTPITLILRKRHAALIAGLIGMATPVHGHAADQGFVLLLPTTLYIAGGTIAVGISLLLTGFVQKSQINTLFRPRVGPLSPCLGGTALSLLSFGLLCVLLWIGLAGPTDPQDNLLPLTIWTLWWTGFVVLQGIFGDLWRWLNPWTGLHRVLMGHRRLATLPQRLKAWPAVGILLAFNLFALADPAPADPRRLAGFVAGYWLFTFAGMVVFGARAWLAQVECFTILMRLFAQLAAVQCGRRLRVGFPGWAALRTLRMETSLAVFCLVLLAAGSFDGLHETFWWLAQIGINPLEFPGRSAVIWQTSLGLIAATALLIAIFAGAVWIGVFCVKILGGTIGANSAFASLALALLPIAFGYHIAHYLVSFLVQFQYVIAGFQRGAGIDPITVTTGFLATPAMVKVIWLTQAGAVVLGHILSVLMAHHIAHRLTRDPAHALWLQAGIGVLMVGYTVFGLWLLASPRGV